MKKFLLIVFMLLLAVPVNGLENNNIKYRYYRLNKIMGPLVFKDSIDDEFPLIDEENPIKTESSELLTERPEEKDGRVIEEYNGYHYLKIPKIDSIEILVRPNYSISNINIGVKSGSINVESDNDGYLSDGSRGIFTLENPTNLNDLIITGRTGGGNDFHSFSIYFKSNNNIVSELSVSTRHDVTFHIYGTQGVLDKSKLEKVYFAEKQNDDNLIYQGITKLYSFFDNQYQSYRLEKEYYPDYLSAPVDDYIYRDDSDYIIELIENDTENEISNLESKENATLDIEKTEAKKENLINRNEDKILASNNNENVNSLEKILEESAGQKDTSDISTSKPKQYQSVLKMDSGKTVSNKFNDNKTYTYFIIVILIILLLLMLKIRKRIKNS